MCCCVRMRAGKSTPRLHLPQGAFALYISGAVRHRVGETFRAWLSLDVLPCI